MILTVNPYVVLAMAVFALAAAMEILTTRNECRLELARPSRPSGWSFLVFPQEQDR